MLLLNPSFERREWESPLPFPPPSKEVLFVGVECCLYKRNLPPKVAFIFTIPGAPTQYRQNLVDAMLRSGALLSFSRPSAPI
jgi:hypothetical protein